jgi:thiol-disulfide isomerase/thioredoxin
MPRSIPFIAWTAALALFTVTLHAEIQFISKPLPLVKDMAARQGKLYFVHFTAQWCMPCRWMDENTFSDPALSDFVQEHYIAVKMDVDDAYGLKCKEEFTIQKLPTVLIFNTKGEVIERREASIDAGSLLTLLQQHSRTEAPRPLAAQARPENPAYPTVGKAVSTPAAPGEFSRPALIPDEPQATAQEMIQPSIMQAVSYSSSPIAEAQTAVGPAPTFTIQAAVFGDYGNAVNEVNRLEGLLRRPVNLAASVQHGATLYKITIGNFSNRQTADDYMRYLQTKSISGFVKTTE